MAALSVSPGWTQSSVRPLSSAADARSEATHDDFAHFAEEKIDSAPQDLQSFIRRIRDDQRQIWSSPLQLRRPAAFDSLLPFAAITAVLIASDDSLDRQVPATWGRQSQTVSNYATFSLAASAASAYGLGRLTHNDHLSETGLLSGEAVVNDILITSALQRAIGRERPYEGNRRGACFQGGSSFPSQHAAIA